MGFLWFNTSWKSFVSPSCSTMTVFNPRTQGPSAKPHPTLLTPMVNSPNHSSSKGPPLVYTQGMLFYVAQTPLCPNCSGLPPLFAPRPADGEAEVESLGAAQRVGAVEGSGGVLHGLL